jgi:translation initiation factor 2 subunit 2
MNTFEQLVDEAYQKLGKKTDKKIIVLPPIQSEITPTKQHWNNVNSFLETISRDYDHFFSFLKTEIPGKEISWFSGSKADGLIIHGKRQNKKDISNIALKYVKNYVICSSCKSSNTTLTKENSNEKFECLDCKAFKFL